MQQAGSLQPETYWDSLRKHESALFDRNQHYTSMKYPDVHATETWYSGNNDIMNPDAVAYNACNRFFERVRSVNLTEFSFQNIGDTGFARVYYLDLRPGREVLEVITYFCRLRHVGLDPKDSRQCAGQKKQARKVGLTVPSPQHFEFIKEQFELGASGAFRIRDPERDS